MQTDIQHFTMQVGDTSQPWRFRLTSRLRAYAIPSGMSFTLYLVSVDAAAASTPKVNGAACTFTVGDDSVYYQPVAGDVDTAGRYRGQLFGVTAAARPERLAVFEVTIRANVVPVV